MNEKDEKLVEKRDEDNAHLLVRLDRKQRKAFERILRELSGIGFKVDNVMEITGIVSGSASRVMIPALRNVEGVLGVREEVVYTLPPVDSNIPQ